jgi:hypothetical protein
MSNTDKLEEALNSFAEFWDTNIYNDGGYPSIFCRQIPDYIIVAGASAEGQPKLEIIKNETLLAMHEEVQKRIADGEEEVEAWSEATDILYEVDESNA